MPLPKTKDVGKVMRFLKAEKPNMPQKQKIAIALSQTGKSKFKKKRKNKVPHYKMS
jgi:hypothetical protein